MTTNVPKKPGEGRKKNVSFDRKVKDFILDKMISGLDLLQVCKKYKEKVPAYEYILRVANKDSEWNKELNDAYGILLMRRLDELNELAVTPPSQLYPEVDWREASETKRAIIDTRKFVLGKMAPVLSSRFQKAEKLEVTGIDVGPKIAVINYYLSEDPTIIDQKLLNNQ